MKPNFKNIDIYAGFQPQNGMEWQKENGITADWKTPEHINIQIHGCRIGFFRDLSLQVTDCLT